MSRRHFVGVLLVAILMFASGASSALAGASGVQPHFSPILPDGQIIDDAELEDVHGELTLVETIIAGIVIAAAAKAIDEGVEYLKNRNEPVYIDYELGVCYF